VLSDGRKVASPKFLRRAERKLKRLQRAHSRKAKGSANREKARVKVARAHAKVADTRRDFHHKVSTAIIRDNQAVYAEDLCVAGLGRTRMAKSVYDAGWSEFVTMLEYKAQRYGHVFGSAGLNQPAKCVRRAESWTGRSEGMGDITPVPITGSAPFLRERLHLAEHELSGGLLGVRRIGPGGLVPPGPGDRRGGLAF